MRKSEIRVGGQYIAKVSNRLVTVRVDSIRDSSSNTLMDGKTSYKVTNLSTGRKVTFRSAAKFRSEVKPKPLGVGGLVGVKVDEVNLPTSQLSQIEELQRQIAALEASEGDNRSDPTQPTISVPNVAAQPTSMSVSATAMKVGQPTSITSKLAAQLSPASQQAHSAVSPSAPHVEVQALAGTGKTSTVVQGLIEAKGGTPAIQPSDQQRAVWDALKLGRLDSVRVSAFNKSITEEMEHKLNGAGLQFKGVEARGVHSLGLQAVTRTFGRVRASQWAVLDMVAAELGGNFRDLLKVPGMATTMKAVDELVSLCKQTLSSPVPEELDKLTSRFDVDCGKHQGRVYDLVPVMLERCKTPQGNITFDDMVWLPVVLDLPIPKVDCQIIDEAQDLNRMQQELVYRGGHRIVFVGDSHQCQPAGTMIRTSNRFGPYLVPIEEVEVGTPVITYDRNGGVFVSNGMVTEASSRLYNGLMYSVKADDKETKCTDSHKWLVRWTNKTDEVWVTYLMRQGTRFRVGQTVMFRQGGEGCFGLSERARVERADVAWVLKVHLSLSEALAYEQVLSCRYGLPEMVFHPPSNIRYFTQEVIDSVYNELGDLTVNAERCLHAHGRLMKYPIYISARESNQERRGRTSLFETQACNLISGYMAAPTVPEDVTGHSKAEWHPLQVSSRQDGWTQVYSLNVDKHHKYIADGLVTCNSIYGFAGADSKSMSRMKAHLSGTDDDRMDANYGKGPPVPGCLTFPLTVTRRCGRAIVAEAQRYVPEYRAHESNPEGSVLVAKYPIQGTGETRRELPWEETYCPLAKDGCVVLCRVNAPLVSQCFRFLKRGIKANILGKKIGEGLIVLVEKSKTHTVSELVGWLDDWLTEEQEKENKKRFPSESKLEMIQDKYDCLLAFTEGLRYPDEVKTKINSVFTDERNGRGVRFSSIHKSKGLEAQQVFLLRPPGSGPRLDKMQGWELQQEDNLAYVAITRAINELIYVS